MDIKNEVLVWVKRMIDSREGVRTFEGFAFDDSGFGLGNDAARDFRGQLVAISSGSRKEFVAKVSIEHHQRNGYLYCVDNDASLEMPCVLSSRCDLACVFDGFVEITRVSDESLRQNEVFETGLPLVGDNWLGLAWIDKDDLRLVAFSEEDLSFDTQQRAYCPWWGDGFSDTDCVSFSFQAADEKGADEKWDAGNSGRKMGERKTGRGQ